MLLVFKGSTGYDYPEYREFSKVYRDILIDLKLPSAEISAKLGEVLGAELASTIFDLFQVTIIEVVKGGQGEALGLQSGDAYLTYNGQTVIRTDQLIRLTSESKGEAVPLEVLRDGKKLTFTAKPGKLGSRIENRPLHCTSGTEPAK